MSGHSNAPSNHWPADDQSQPLSDGDVAVLRAMAGHVGAGLIASERLRQVQQEGWTPEHDDDHGDGALASAARCYVNAAIICENAQHTEFVVRDALRRHGVVPEEDPDFLAMLAHPVVHNYGGMTPADWPWHADWWKPSTDAVRNLVKAGALIAAEIDRVQRARTSGRSPSSGDAS